MENRRVSIPPRTIKLSAVARHRHTRLSELTAELGLDGFFPCAITEWPILVNNLNAGKFGQATLTIAYTSPDSY